MIQIQQPTGYVATKLIKEYDFASDMTSESNISINFGVVKADSDQFTSHEHPLRLKNPWLKRCQDCGQFIGKKQHNCLGKGWSKKFDCCVKCGTIQKYHQGYGLCSTCYSIYYRHKKNPDMKYGNKLPEGKWSNNFDCCIHCGTTKIKHNAKGICTTCTSEILRRKNPEIGRKDRWALHYNQCSECHTTKLKHYAFGLCIKCYRYKKAHELNPNMGSQKRWALYYNQCVKCGTTEIAHKKQGFCKICYQKEPETRARSLRSQSKRRSLVKGFKTVGITLKVQKYVRGRDKNKCIICGQNQNISFDHLIAITKLKEKNFKGDPNGINNIVLLCKSCNSSKNNKDILNWLKEKNKPIPNIIIKLLKKQKTQQVIQC